MRLSIVIAEMAGETAAQSCSESLRRLAHGRDLEIIVMRGAPGSSICTLRLEGIARAKGEKVAILGETYRVTPGWIDAAESASSFDVTGGPIAPGPNLSYLSWSIYLSEYARVAPPIAPGPVSDPKEVPGGNVVYRKSVLNDVSLSGCSTELEFHGRLQKSGASFGLRSEMEVFYAVQPTLRGYIRERFCFSRAIAAGRGHGWRTALAPGLPFLSLLRCARAVFGKRQYRLRWFACAPAILLLGFVQTCGELSELLSYLRPRSGEP